MVSTEPGDALAQQRKSARDLGVIVGVLPPGPLNAITDVAGVEVGQTTLIRGEGRLVAGRGPRKCAATYAV